MIVQFTLFISGILAVVVPLTSLQSLDQEVTTNTQLALAFDTVYPENSYMTPSSNQWRHKKKRLRHRGRKNRHQNRHSLAKRYFEKQLLVRNRTLALLGVGLEKFLPNAVDLLDINPQELPGESPFQNWHSQKPNQTHEISVNTKNISRNGPTVILKPTKLLEMEQEKSDVSGVESGQVIEYQYDYEALRHEDTGQLQLNFGTALKKLLDIFVNYSSQSKLKTTPCEQWIECREQLKVALTGLLPACPCDYPSSIFYEDKVWDSVQSRYFRWRDASGERLDVYKPGAEYCIRSLLTRGTPTLAVQQCCYDRHRQLLTRGSGAGNPNLVSPDVSPQLHDTVDVLPWRLCKGDFTVYNRVRPPNNGNNCTVNPDNEEFKRQVQLTKYY